MLLIGGYSLMATWAILFMVVLSLQVSVTLCFFGLKDPRSSNSARVACWGLPNLPIPLPPLICPTTLLALQEQFSWMPYLSMACIFAYILSFGIGPGELQEH